MVGKLKTKARTIVVRECSRCHARWPSDWDYCQNCAIWLRGNERLERITSVVPRTGAAAEALKKLGFGATVLAVEVRCDSELSVSATIERGRKLLKRALAVIGMHGGETLQIADRGIVGCWRGRQRSTDQAASALCRLIGKNKSGGHIGSLMRTPAEPVSLGMGVVQVDGNPIDAMDRAFRLAALAHPNRAFFASEKYEQSVEQFDFQGLQPVVAKSEPLEPVFELLGPKPERSGTNHIGPDKIPMVGRRKLLETITQCSQEAASGRCIVVHVVAEPGQGKSKLIRQWLTDQERMAALHGWIRLFCTGVPYGDYAFRSWLCLVAPVTHRKRLGPNIHIDNVTIIAQKLRLAKRPALLIVDDLHWIDADSRELMVSLISELRQALVVLSYRPSFASNALIRMRSPADNRYFRIAPLSRNEIKQLVALLVAESSVKLSPVRLHEIIAKSHGSPLYAQEAIAHLAEVGSGRTRRLPSSLLELLIQRVQWSARELLPELERHQRAYQFGTDDKKELLHEVECLEERLSGWLDRFDAVQEESQKLLARFLKGLQSVDGELGLLSILLGRQRPHRNRLAQALTRVQRFVDGASSKFRGFEDPLNNC
jgi:hypothetical protein